MKKMMVGGAAVLGALGCATAFVMMNKNARRKAEDMIDMATSETKELVKKVK